MFWAMNYFVWGKLKKFTFPISYAEEQGLSKPQQSNFKSTDMINTNHILPFNVLIISKLHITTRCLHDT